MNRSERIKCLQQLVLIGVSGFSVWAAHGFPPCRILFVKEACVRVGISMTSPGKPGETSVILPVSPVTTSAKAARSFHSFQEAASAEVYSLLDPFVFNNGKKVTGILSALTTHCISVCFIQLKLGGMLPIHQQKGTTVMGGLVYRNSWIPLSWPNERKLFL